VHDKEGLPYADKYDRDFLELKIAKTLRFNKKGRDFKNGRKGLQQYSKGFL